MLLAITQLFFHLQYQSLLLSLHQICFLGPWYSFVQILYPKIKATPWFFPEPLPLIIVTSITMQYFEMVSINHLCQEKVKLGRHTVLYQATPCFGCWVALGQRKGRAFQVQLFTKYGLCKTTLNCYLPSHFHILYPIHFSRKSDKVRIWRQKNWAEGLALVPWTSYSLF